MEPIGFTNASKRLQLQNIMGSVALLNTFRRSDKPIDIVPFAGAPSRQQRPKFHLDPPRLFVAPKNGYAIDSIEINCELPCQSIKYYQRLERNRMGVIHFAYHFILLASGGAVSNFLFSRWKLQFLSIPFLCYIPCISKHLRSNEMLMGTLDAP